LTERTGLTYKSNIAMLLCIISKCLSKKRGKGFGEKTVKRSGLTVLVRPLNNFFKEGIVHA
jgi:hypothetical protein